MSDHLTERIKTFLEENNPPVAYEACDVREEERKQTLCDLAKKIQECLDRNLFINNSGAHQAIGLILTCMDVVAKDT